MTETLPNSLTVNRISELTGVDRRALKSRLAAAGLSGGPWPVGVILKALLAGPMADGTIADARRRQALARAKMAEMEAGKMAGELGSVAEWEQTVSVVIIEARRRLLAVPAVVANRICFCRDAAEAERLLRDAIEDALRELSRGIDFDAAESAVKNGEHEQVA